MRALYEINADLEALLSQVDEETGEVLIDPEALDALLLERTEKLEGVALAVKNVTAEAAAIKAEEDTLKKRRQALEKKKDGLLKYLSAALEGEKFETARVVVSYRRSVAAKVVDEDAFWENPAEAFVRTKREANIEAIRAALKDGGIIPGAALVENVTMNIK